MVLVFQQQPSTSSSSPPPSELKCNPLARGPATLCTFSAQTAQRNQRQSERERGEEGLEGGLGVRSEQEGEEEMKGGG